MKNTQSFSNCHLKLLDFDYNYYVNKYPDLLKAGINNPKVAAWHYLNYGIEEGRFKNQTDKIEKTYQLRLKTEEEKKIYEQQEKEEQANAQSDNLEMEKLNGTS